MNTKHIKLTTSVRRADTTAESLFFTLYFTVIYIMFTAALAEKSN